jgi:hypothetical protein
MNLAYQAGNGQFIPEYMMPGLLRYIEHGILPGSFLQAVLRNDFREVVSRADDLNLQNLRAYRVHLYNEAPGACYGSPEKVAAWVAMKAAEREAAGSAS